MISVRRVFTFSMLGFLLLMILVIGTGCATMSKEQLAAATQLGYNDRGVVVANLSHPPQPIKARIYAPGRATIWGPDRSDIQPSEQHAFVVQYAGGQSVTVSVWLVDSHGRPVGKPESIDVYFPWEHWVGNAVDYRRNHIMLVYENGRLRRRN